MVIILNCQILCIKLSLLYDIKLRGFLGHKYPSPSPFYEIKIINLHPGGSKYERPNPTELFLPKITSKTCFPTSYFVVQMQYEGNRQNNKPLNKLGTVIFFVRKSRKNVMGWFKWKNMKLYKIVGLKFVLCFLCIFTLYSSNS